MPLLRATATPRREDIEAWQKARELTNEIYKATSDENFKQDFGLKDQIQRASVSIMANIAEGFGSNTDKDYIRFLNYAFRSLLEVRSHLYVAIDLGYLSEETFEEITQLAVTTKKLIRGFIRYLEKA